jgi:hypothetical protein
MQEEAAAHETRGEDWLSPQAECHSGIEKISRQDYYM